MNMHTIVLDKQQAAFMAAAERAEKWIETARPIILAMFAVEDASGEHLFQAKIKARGDRRYDAPKTTDERTYEEAQSCLATAYTCLFEMLDGIRSDFLCDEMLPQPKPDASEQDWTDRDEFSDGLDGCVTSVADAIKQIGKEA